MAAKIEPLLTVADLDACPDDNNRYELIGGELFVSRAPGIPHQRVVLNLEISISRYLEDNPVGILVPRAGSCHRSHFTGRGEPATRSFSEAAALWKIWRRRILDRRSREQTG